MEIKFSIMKTIGLYLLIVFSTPLAYSQQEKIVESKITEVTVFLNKAQISRNLKSKIEPGKTNLILSGLTSQLDKQSIQVGGKGNFIILGINHSQNYLNEINLPKPFQQLKDSLDYLQRQLSVENSRKEVLSKEEQMLSSNQKIGGANQNLTANELKAMADFYRARLNEIAVERMKQDEKIKKLSERSTKIQRQLKDQTDHYSRNTSEIIISLSADAPTSVELEVNYLVEKAGWNAVYDLRAINTKSPIQLSYKANVYQNTGEEWKNVRLKLSTANPTLSGMKPELTIWYLNFYERMSRGGYDAKKKVLSSMSPSAVSEQSARYKEEEAEPERIADFTTTVQTSLSTEFDIALPYTVNSSNKPTLIDIRNHELKAAYTYSVAPKLDTDAFLIAHALGWEEFSLLPGEANIFFEGTFVAKTSINPNTIKDTLSISLGRDKRIVVKREKLKEYVSKKLIGTNQRDDYAYEISIRNAKSEPITITVQDQVPISQNSQIEVIVEDVGSARHNKDTGKLTWEIELQPNEAKKVRYRFGIKYPKDKQVVNVE
jgi:uncharacterized protein (TIGR02231 family)